MAQLELLKQSIREVIKRNGNEEITGDLLQQTLIAMVNIMGNGFAFKGIATPVTQPGTPDNNIFYIASESGNYPNFGIEVLADELAVLMWNGQWEKQTILNTGFSEQFVDFSTEQVIQALKIFAGGIKVLGFENIIDNSGQNLQNMLDDKATIAALQAIIDKIPAQASTENQLADKEFVNSSIATNTANFVGTFNSLEELEEYPIVDLTNNDYAFVISDGAYLRYKWNTEQWLFEYELNNSTFTAAQWATINCGLTSNDATAIRAALTLIGNVIPDDASAVNKLISRKYVEDRHIILPLLSWDATQEQLQMVYESIVNAPVGSAFFISLPENRGIMPLATAKYATSVFAQYSDGRYSHELKITLDDGVYVFEKWDVEMVDHITAREIADVVIYDELASSGAITKAIIENQTIFIAEFKETPWQDVMDAYDAGKEIFARVRYGYNNAILPLVGTGATADGRMTFNFVGGKNNEIISWGVYCSPVAWQNQWDNLSYVEGQRTSFRQTVITESNSHYPSSKAVIDYVKGAINVFVAEYGVTTIDEIVNAWNEGKIILVRQVTGPQYNNRVSVLGSIWPDGRLARFYAIEPQVLTFYTIQCSGSGWITTSINAQSQIGNLTNLETSAKNNIVAAINELYNLITSR